MPRKYLMSWRGKPYYDWRKQLDGEPYRVTCEELGLPISAWTEELSYQAANQWWLAQQKPDRLTQTVQATVAAIPMDRLRQMIEQGNIAKEIVKNGPDEITAETVDRILAMGEPFGGKPLEEDERIEMLGKLGAKLGHAVPPDYRLEHQTTRFLSFHRAREKKPDTYGELREYVLKIIDTPPLSKNMDVRTITESTVMDYYLALKKNPYVPGTKIKVFGFFKRLVRYLWSQKLIDLPRNLGERSFDFGPTHKKIKTYHVDQVRTCLAELKDRFLLYALLALNCGMYGVDMGKMKHTELDTENWRIKRKRSKTEEQENVPEVEYKLWPETVAILKRHISQHPTHVLTSSTGTVLYDSRYKGDDEIKKDLIGNQWRKAKIKIPLSHFRSIRLYPN